jgi:hypothetical protein
MWISDIIGQKKYNVNAILSPVIIQEPLSMNQYIYFWPKINGKIKF